jgi:hypothetical protein
MEIQGQRPFEDSTWFYQLAYTDIDRWDANLVILV